MLLHTEQKSNDKYERKFEHQSSEKHGIIEKHKESILLLKKIAE